MMKEMRIKNYERYLDSLLDEKLELKIKEKKPLLQRIAFRLSIDKHETINSVLEDGKYNNQSNFFRSAVDLLLFWENELDVDEVTDPSLQKSIRYRFSEIETALKDLPSIREEVKELKQIREEAGKLKLLLLEGEKCLRELAKAMLIVEPVILDHTNKLTTLANMTSKIKKKYHLLGGNEKT